MNPTPAAILAIAKRYTDQGYREGPNNDTIFGKRYGLNHQPWCDMYVSDIFVEAGAIRAIAPKSSPKGFASCDAHLKHLAKNGQLVPVGKAQPGDLVFFQFDDDAQPDHIGIVKANRPRTRTLVCFEGNTSGDSKGSQSNGDGCFEKKRSYSLVMAVARPNWSLVAPAK
ncbi:hypothetical protein UFOVP1608_40 [uncultured Caudovirales phage]|uniref:CHAP domain containing protein n=1 Tax=uncultured Caudovirales phage TaxID=2100421 RepID=A0A6J5STL9_9CAUD|nr:hypothetical protein UFOVP1608_40 [uncultured Caudovirales phage]